VFYNSTNKTWANSGCTSTTKILAAEAACCSYFLTNLLSVEDLSEAIFDEEVSAFSSIIIPAVAILAFILLGAATIRYITQRQVKNKYVEENDEHEDNVHNPHFRLPQSPEKTITTDFDMSDRSVT
jgi:hypothetical protein